MMPAMSLITSESILGDADVLRNRMHRADRVADRALGMSAAAVHGLDGMLQVAVVVECIEDTEYIDAVAAGQFDKTVQQVIGVVTVAKDVLPAQQHLQWCFLGVRLDHAQPFPRILAEESEADIECCTTPYLEGVVPCVVDGVDDPLDVARAHPGGPERLVGIAQGRVSDPHLTRFLDGRGLRRRCRLRDGFLCSRLTRGCALLGCRFLLGGGLFLCSHSVFS
jgi:hypothetical protein